MKRPQIPALLLVAGLSLTGGIVGAVAFTGPTQTPIRERHSSFDYLEEPQPSPSPAPAAPTIAPETSEPAPEESTTPARTKVLTEAERAEAAAVKAEGAAETASSAAERAEQAAAKVQTPNTSASPASPTAPTPTPSAPESPAPSWVEVFSVARPAGAWCFDPNPDKRCEAWSSQPFALSGRPVKVIVKGQKPPGRSLGFTIRTGDNDACSGNFVYDTGAAEISCPSVQAGEHVLRVLDAGQTPREPAWAWGITIYELAG
jgi:hypothetical protein